jgi:isopenicillin N synthase-like dioxygenase
MSTNALPIIDLSAYLSGTAAGGTLAADAIRRACEEIGFFLIAGHGVEDALIEKTYASVKRFFDLPLGEKMQVARPSAAVSRGYDKVGGQALAKTLGVSAPPDLQEIFAFGQPQIGDAPYYREGFGSIHFAPNLWPQRPADFRANAEDYYRAMVGLSRNLMRLFALALKLPEDFFDARIDRQISNIRFLNYPDQPDAPVPGQLRAGAHSDYGTLTILRIEDAPGGLQVRDRQGRWIDVGYVPGTFVVNIGDLMMQWTNDVWISTVHRVVNPPRDRALGARRISMAFFHQPNYDAEIACLEACRSAERPPKYAPTTSGAHWRAKTAASRPAKPLAEPSLSNV